MDKLQFVKIFLRSDRRRYMALTARTPRATYKQGDSDVILPHNYAS